MLDPAIVDFLQGQDGSMEEPPMDVISPSTDDPRPILQRGSKFSAEALKNGAIRMKSCRQPPSSRDICWMENREMQENMPKRAFTPAIPPPSWSRFPSHTRAERSLSSAGIEDLVFARDFALERLGKDLGGGEKGEEGEQGWGKKFRRHTLEKSVAQKLRRYHTASLRPTRSGFRSSISVGGVLEYPELAILPSLEAVPLVSRATSPSPIDTPEPNTAMGRNLSTSHDPGPDREDEVDGARVWSQMYQGCLLPRPGTSDETPKNSFSANSFLHPDCASRHSRQSSRNSRQSSRPSRKSSERRRPSPCSSSEMRSSTVNFQKALEEYEIKARERALQAASDASLRRPKEVN